MDKNKSIGLDIEKIITKVKKAVRRAQEDAKGNGPNVEVEKLDLTLKTFKERGAGVGLQVPIVSKTLGLDGNLLEQETQIIELTLEPVEELRLFGPEEIEKDLVEAIQGIREGLRKALDVSPRFKLKGASVELNFVAGREGEISIVARGSLKSNTTHKLKLFLRLQSENG